MPTHNLRTSDVRRFLLTEVSMDDARSQMFEAKAQKILTYLKSAIRYDQSLLPRPFFIEITGTPSAGKSTIITELDKFFRRQGFRVLKPQEGAEVIRHIERDTPLYNLATCDYARRILVDEGKGHRYDIVIFDRCLFDGYCWMEYWKSKNMLSDEETILFQSFFLSRFWVNSIDLAYFIVCDPAIAVGRELRVALSKKLGDTTNPKSIERLLGIYQRAYTTLSPAHPQLRLLDTANISEQAMVEVVAEKALSVFEQKVDEHPA